MCVAESAVDMYNWIPMFRPSLPSYQQLEKYIVKIDNARVYSNFGPLDKEVRERFSDYLGLPVDNLVTCANATIGIEGAISTSVATGQWSLPSWTFTATAAALNKAKGTGLFLDIDENWRVIPDGSTANLIDVLPFGQTIGSPKRYLDYGVRNLILDAAASFDGLAGQSWNDFPEFAGILSFHATKVLPAGEGGLFFSNSKEWARRFRNWTRFGMDLGRTSADFGTNAKWSEYHAAVLLASMDKWSADRQIWIRQILRANQLASKHGFSSSPQLSTQLAIPYWIVQHEEPKNIIELKKTFHELNIETRSWWETGCHEMPAYKHFKVANLSATSRIAAQTIGLPFWIDMNEKIWERIDSAFQLIEPK